MRTTSLLLAVFASVACAATQTQTVGLFYHDSTKSYQGYTLFTGKHHGLTLLMDNQGREVHRWMSSYEPGQSVYLLDDGDLLRCALLKGQYSIGGGEGGRFELYGWDGDTIWQFDYASNDYMSHHDVAPLPSLPDGRHRFLALAVERKTRAECAAAGFDTTKFQESYISPEYVVEFVQNGRNGYTIAWEWHVWDHLIQDEFPSKANYGNPALHPELIDVNSGTGGQFPSFWNHANSIKYNAKYDQIAISIRGNSEFWILDHGTTTAQAATVSGGARGKGGAILYRWGNPAAYGAGTQANRRLYQQHDAQWIEDGLPGAGNFLIYNNGIDRPGDKFSSVEEVDIPQDTNGNFPALASGSAFGPAEATWHYQASNPTDFYSAEVSGVQRLPNGNTLVCEGIPGHFFELTPEGEIVWDYVNPLVDFAILSQGETPEIDPRGHPMNAIFKIHRYAPDYPGLAGRTLVPGNQIELNPWTTGVAKEGLSVGGLRVLNLASGGRGEIVLGSHASEGLLRIFDNRGAQILSKSFSGTRAEFPIGQIPAGIYHVQVRFDGRVEHRALVVH